MAVPITIIIPVKPGGAVRALERLTALRYPAGDVEVLVAEGCRPSRQRNRAADQARGAILYFLDDDSLAEPDNLNRLVRQFEAGTVAVVGGPSLTPADDTPWQQAFGLALASRCGGGAVRNRYRRSGVVRATDDSEIILCNLAFRAAVYRELGGLDERLYPNEENELLQRVARAGGTILHDPDLVVHRSQRSGFRAFVRQMFTYGRGRGEQTRIGGPGGLATFAPTGFLLYLASLLLVHNPVYYLPLICYAGVVAAAVLAGVAESGRPLLAVRLLPVFPTLHLAYGAGMLVGLAAPRYRNPGTGETAVTVRVVKEMGRPWPGTAGE